MKGWERVKLADYYEISSGLSKPASEFGSGYPFLSFSDIFKNYFVPETLSQLVNSSAKERMSCSVKKGDVFLTRTSETIEELGMSSVALKDYENTTFNGFTKRLRPKFENEIDPCFIGFYLRSPRFRADISAYSNLITRASLNNEIINRLWINLPPINVQREISDILNNYELLFENNLKRIKLLEELAQRTYEEWFVKFRINGEQLAVEAETGLPEGWERRKLVDVGDITSSKRIFLSDYVEKGIPFYRSKEVIQKSRYENIDEPLYITNNRYEEIKAKFGYPKAGDFLITSVGTIGYVHLVSKQDGNFYFKDGNLIWIRNVENSVLIPYLLYTFRREDFKNMLNSISIGSSQKALTIIAVKKIEIILPPENILRLLILI
jgi:type I restriction enzyme, S subunit